MINNEISTDETNNCQCDIWIITTKICQVQVVPTCSPADMPNYPGH